MVISELEMWSETKRKSVRDLRVPLDVSTMDAWILIIKQKDSPGQ